MKGLVIKTQYKSIHVIFHISIFLISAMIILRDMGAVSIPKAAFVIVGALALIVADKEKIYCFMAFLTPMATGISYTYLSLIACVIIAFKMKVLRYDKIILISIVSILIIEAISAFRFEFDFLDYARFCGVFLICFLRMADIDTEYNDLAMLKYFNFGFIITTLCLWGQMLRKYSFLSILTMGIRFGNTQDVLQTEGMAITFNQNVLGFLCIVAIWISYFLYKIENKVGYLITFFLGIVQGIMTQSRAFVLALVFLLVLLVFAFSESIKKAIQAIVTWSLVILAAGIVMFQYLESYMESLILRFKVSDITGGRTSIFTTYFDLFFEDPLNWPFGVGLQDYKPKYGMETSSHNSLQEVLITWGFVGLIIVIFMFFVILRNVKIKNPNVKLIQYAPFCTYLLLTQSIQGFQDRAGMLRLMVTYSVMMVSMTKLSKPKEEPKLQEKINH